MKDWWPHLLVIALLAMVGGLVGARLNTLTPSMAGEEPKAPPAGGPGEDAWLARVQMPAAMRKGLGVSLQPVPNTPRWRGLAAHLAGDCKSPGAPQDALTPLRKMRCLYTGGGAPPQGESVKGLSPAEAAELSTYFSARLHLAACQADECDRLAMDALRDLQAGPTREAVFSRWAARTGVKSGGRYLAVLNAFLSGDVPDSPDPQIQAMLANLQSAAVLSPRAALGLLRYAEKPLTAAQFSSAALRAADLRDPGLAYEARYYVVASGPSGTLAEMALRDLAQGGAAARPWFSKALYRKCRGRYYAKRWQESAACFRVVEEQGQEEKDLAQWFQGISLWKAGSPEAAQAAWKRLWDGGKDETGGESAWVLGRHLWKNGGRARAVELARMAETRFPFATYTGDLVAMVESNMPAGPRLANLFRRTPHSLGAAGLVEANGGQGPSPLRDLPAWRPSTEGAHGALALLLAGEPQAAMALARLGEDTWDSRKWRPEHRLIRAWGLSELGNYLAGVKTIELLWYQNGYDALARTPAFQSVLYPLYYLPEARAAGEEMDIPVPYLYGIMRQESRFMHRIRSRSGAIGLSQIMPSTGAAIAKWLNESDAYSPASLDAPAKNLRYGARYLAYLKEKFGPDPRLMAGGYNGGPGNVQRWLNKNGYARPWDWVEAMHLDETRDYVKKVVHNAWMYKHLYPQFPCPGALCAIQPDPPRL